MIKILYAYKEFDFFDGKDFQKNCLLNKYCPFGTNLFSENSKSFIRVIDKYSDIHRDIVLFQKWKNLSASDPSTGRPSGLKFERNDLTTLAEVLGLAFDNTHNHISGSREMSLNEGHPYDIIVLWVIDGQKEPEGIYVQAILNVELEDWFKEKYFSHS